MPQGQPSRQQPEGLGSEPATMRTAEVEQKAEFPASSDAPASHAQPEGGSNGHAAHSDAPDLSNGYGSSTSTSPTTDQPDADGHHGAEDRKRNKKKGRPRSRKNTGPGKDDALSAMMANLSMHQGMAHQGMAPIPPHMMQQFGQYGPNVNMGMSPMVPVMGGMHPMAPQPVPGPFAPPQQQQRQRRMTGDSQPDMHPSGPQAQAQGQQGGRRHRDLFPVGTYKTEICRSHLQTGYCEYGPNCQFAHGIHELRPRHFDVKYKTQLCKNYHKDGNCRFGSRCKFIHDEHRIQVDANEFWLVSPSENLVRVEIVENPQRRAQLQLLVETPPPPPPVDPSLANSPAAKELEDRRKIVLENARIAASRAAYARQQGQQPFLGGSGGVPVQVGAQGPSMGSVAAPGGPMGGVTVSPPMPMPFAKPPAHMPNNGPGPSPVPMGANPAYMNGPVPPYPQYFAGPPPMYPMPPVPMGVYPGPPQQQQQAPRF